MKTKISALFLGIVFFIAGCADKGSPKVVEGFKLNPDSLAATTKMMIIAKVTLKADKADAFIEAAKDIIQKSNSEPGCSFYQLYRDPYDATKFVFVEEYKDQAAVDYHFSMDYFSAFGTQIADWVAAPAEIKIISVAGETIK